MSDKITIICVNGPPRSGKDTVGDFIRREAQFKNKKILVMKFAQPIIDNVKRVLGISDYTFDVLMQGDKDRPMKELGYDISIRQLMINFSEDFIKPSLGKNWFAKNLAARIKKLDPKVISGVVVTDSGFQDEHDDFKEDLKDDFNVFLMQLRRDGCNFNNDSREYVYGPDMIAIENNGTIKDLHNKIVEISNEH